MNIWKALKTNDDFTIVINHNYHYSKENILVKCIKINKGSAVFHTLDFDEDVDELGYYRIGNEYKFNRKEIAENIFYDPRNIIKKIIRDNLQRIEELKSENNELSKKL